MIPSRRQLLAIGALGLAVRTAYVLVARPVIPFLSDGQTYHLLAKALADGRGYIAPFDWFFHQQVRPTAQFGPAHPSMLAITTLLGASSVRAQQLTLGLVGSVTPVLTALLAGRITCRPRAALAAGLVAAVHPMLFGSDGALMSETLYALLGLVVVLALLQPGRWWSLLAGVAVGLAVLTRGDGLLLIPCVVLPTVLLHHRKASSMAAALRAVATVAVVATAVVAPWVVRNYARFDGRLVLSNNVGSLISGANCPASYAGPSMGSWDFRCAYAVKLRGADEAANSAVLRNAGLRYARDHASRLPLVAPARLLRAWGVLHPFGQARAEVTDGRVLGAQVAGVVLDWVLVPLFLVGVIALRRRGRPIAPLVGMVALVSLLVALSYGSSRLRELAEPALIVGAVAGIDSLLFTRRR